MSSVPQCTYAEAIETARREARKVASKCSFSRQYDGDIGWNGQSYVWTFTGTMQALGYPCDGRDLEELSWFWLDRPTDSPECDTLCARTVNIAWQLCNAHLRSSTEIVVRFIWHMERNVFDALCTHFAKVIADCPLPEVEDDHGYSWNAIVQIRRIERIYRARERSDVAVSNVLAHIVARSGMRDPVTLIERFLHDGAPVPSYALKPK